MGQHPGRGRQKFRSVTPYAGLTTCLRCDAAFVSWDRRQNRLCKTCTEAIQQEPSEEPSYRIPRVKGRRGPAHEE
jgi:hypothetical protein